jgi:hypothetical protein
MKTLIRVTQEHIDRGKPGDGCSCPVSLAMRDATKYHCHVCRSTFYIRDLEIDLPEQAKQFINAFDSLGHVSPFEFELDIPELANA